jgi:hypothetical protein
MGDISEGVNAVFYISLCTIFCTSISLAFKFCYKSKCREVDLCCLKIIRDVDVEKQEDLSNINTLDSPNNKQLP